MFLIMHVKDRREDRVFLEKDRPSVDAFVCTFLMHNLTFQHTISSLIFLPLSEFKGSSRRSSKMFHAMRRATVPGFK